MTDFIGGTVVIFIVAALVGGTVYGCSNSNQQYWAAQKACFDFGGSLVANASNGRQIDNLWDDLIAVSRKS